MSQSELGPLLALASRDPVVAQLAAQWPAGHVNLSGPVDSQKAFLLMALARQLGRPVLLIVPDELAARRHAAALTAFGEASEVAVFRRRELELGYAEAASREEELNRLGILRRLWLGQLRVLVVAGAALLQRLPTPALWREMSLTLRWGETYDIDALSGQLSGLGYERVNQAQLPGQFARRGDILDVVPVGLGAAEGEGLGYRLSFFDTELDQLKAYDLDSQRALDGLEEVVVSPARERLFDPETRAARVQDIRQVGNEAILALRRKQVDQAYCDRLRDLLDRDLLDLEEGHDAPGLDKWLAYLLDGEAGILEHGRAAGCLVAADEPLRLRERLDQAQAEHYERVKVLIERAQSFAQAETSQLGVGERMRALDQGGPVLSLASIAAAGNGLPGASALSLQGRAAESYRGRDMELVAMLRRRQEDGLDTWFMTSSPERAERLREQLRDSDVHVMPPIWPASLATGFEWPAAQLLVLGTEDVFGVERQRRRRKRFASGQRIDFFSDLQPGEMVVHESYGIGLYEGLSTQADSRGVRRDFLSIRYAGDDRLFLPMEQLDQIQRYVGTDGREPKLTRLGTAEWSRMKERARNAVRSLATDLVALYARRSVIEGHAFQPETSWDREFADAFPYEETEDQLRSIEEVTRDMESPRVMDRLLCGDVGFGKTEVAFRAMFKCVGDSRQAAMLAPTTVLAQQHYLNLVERVADFPVRVGLLSRFVSPAEQRRVVRGLASGSIDIVIGTHRMLSRDIRFKRLGLLVVDEEQRFGVDHKERIKDISPDVDVLSLSATPIPRTLHMSMSGIRDISVIEEAPEDRRPVQTYVMEYDDAVIEDAILRELGRGGQVFYLYNDTYRIADRARRLAEQLPGARILHAHGRMSERSLEEVIQAFIEGEADILVCTTIIESGIDMPNVNTIVVERADRLGLATLYQLRGRVGRSNRQAYAYITYRRDQVLSEVAEKRLTAIRDFTELGAGFKIALRDLEVRGAGNLLGAEQHGQMEAIGYDLYTRMLDEEIRRARREAKLAQAAADGGADGDGAPAAVISGHIPGSPRQQLLEPDPEARVESVVDLALDSYIPAGYIEDEGERMDMYRRIGGIASLADYRDVLDELSDRYGEPPTACLTLCDVALVREVAGQLGITRIGVQADAVVLQLATETRPDMAKLLALLNLEAYRGQLQFNAGQKPGFIWRQAGSRPAAVPARLRRLFGDLDAHLQQEAAALGDEG